MAWSVSVAAALENRLAGDYEELDDHELATSAALGDERAFAVLMTRHREFVYAVALRITGHVEDALDAQQETLTRAWRFIGRFDHRSRFSTWLYRIAANAALAEVGRRDGRRELITDPAPHMAAERATGELVDQRLIVSEALARLPPPYRAAIVLREVCGCSYAEIADILRIPLNTVKSRIARARTALPAHRHERVQA